MNKWYIAVDQKLKWKMIFLAWYNEKNIRIKHVNSKTIGTNTNLSVTGTDISNNLKKKKTQVEKHVESGKYAVSHNFTSYIWLTGRNVKKKMFLLTFDSIIFQVRLLKYEKLQFILFRFEKCDFFIRNIVLLLITHFWLEHMELNVSRRNKVEVVLWKRSALSTFSF